MGQYKQVGYETSDRLTGLAFQASDWLSTTEKAEGLDAMAGSITLEHDQGGNEVAWTAGQLGGDPYRWRVKYMEGKMHLTDHKEGIIAPVTLRGEKKSYRFFTYDYDQDCWLELVQEEVPA